LEKKKYGGGGCRKRLNIGLVSISAIQVGRSWLIDVAFDRKGRKLLPSSIASWSL
jgi:hypothetical protein